MSGFKKDITYNMKEKVYDINFFMMKRMIQLFSRKIYVNKDKVEHLLHHDVYL